MTSALIHFAENKIRVVKEEAATSHVNQAYDQFQAKAGKSMARPFWDLARLHVKGHIDQWNLIAILIVTIKSIPGETWVKSFKRVNLHPDFRILFDAWLIRIDNHIITGEAAYTRKNESAIYDAMPAFWKNMPIENMTKL